MRMYDNELINGEDHSKSLDHYKTHRQVMDEGSEVFNPSRFSSKDGHISAIQKLMELRHQIGKAFDAEYQMQPRRYTCALDITPRQVAHNLNGLQEGETPEGTTLVIASSDLNLSYAVTSVIIAFRPDMTAHVIWHGISKCRLDYKANDAEFSRALYDILEKEGRKLKGVCPDIQGWGIDASGRPFDTVAQFAKNSSRAVGIPACAMLGRASHAYNGYVRSRLRDEINRTVLCGDPREHIKSGSGAKYTYWDSDYYRAATQKAFLSKPGAVGSCTVYGDTPESHTEYANQMTNEKLKYIKHRQDGRDIYTWQTAEPHDYLDATA